jgi:hypothetical protein
MPSTLNKQQLIEQLRAALRSLGLEENRDFWLVDNATNWKLRWLDHTAPEQYMQDNELALNSLVATWSSARLR